MRISHRIGSPLPQAERARLAKLVKQHGEKRVMARFGLSRTTLYRALAELGLRRGTILLISVRLEEVDPSDEVPRLDRVS